jgi:hypothetical protein
MPFSYGPFSLGAKVLYYNGDSKWHIGTIQGRTGGTVTLFVDGVGCLMCPESDCFPTNHSDIAMMVAEYNRLQEETAMVSNEISKFLKRKHKS